MIKKIRFLMLTKSSKHHKHCVAGIDLDKNGLIRLCSSDQTSGGALSSDNLKSADGSVFEVGDVVEIEMLRRVPSEIQVENLLINEEVAFVKLGEFSLQKIASFTENDEFIFGNTSYKLTSDEAKLCRKSLHFVSVDNLTISYNGNKTKCDFFYKGRFHKHFTVTDPDYFDLPQPIRLKQALVCFSLPDDTWAKNEDSYFKFMAKIIPYEKPSK